MELSKQESALSEIARVALARESQTEAGSNENVSQTPSGETKGDGGVVEMAKVELWSLTPAEVKRRTGFNNLRDLSQCTAICYGGDLNEMMRTATKLDWLEELILFCEHTHHRTAVRMGDFAKSYGINERALKKVIACRLEKELECRERWPMHVSHEEDAKFRDPKWNDEFKSHPHVVMHDATNFSMQQPSAGDMQRALHSKHHGECCAKGGAAAQLSNWIFGLPLVTGHSDDDQQIQQTKILQLQKLFAENDLVHGEVKGFLNIFDKGYHQTLEAKKLGQLCLQPDRSDMVSEYDTSLLRAASVAVTRSGNERAVKRAKLSWFISRGMKHTRCDIDRACDVWEAWTFRVNFMHKGFQ